MLSAILFDLDGTLANTDPLHFLTWQDTLTEFGLTIDRAFYQKHISGRLNSEIVKDILPQLPHSQGLAVADAKEARFRELGRQLQPLAGLTTLLNWTKARQLKQALVTNAPRENARFMLDVLNLESAFSTVVLAEDVDRGKPYPDPYQLALKRLEVTPDSAIAFEDSPSGIRSAVAAGLTTIAVASTHDRDRLLDVGAQMVISDFTDPVLWQWLE